jgi:hypothetical protein
MWKIPKREMQTIGISANQRAWNYQKDNPTLCRLGCGIKLVFLKDMGGITFPCEARKFQVRDGNMSMMLEDGSISSYGYRFGWPLHRCPKDPKNSLTVNSDR